MKKNLQDITTGRRLHSPITTILCSQHFLPKKGYLNLFIRQLVQFNPFDNGLVTCI
jgi:hypothetical protein